MSLSSFSLSSDGGAVNLGWAGEAAEVMPVEELPPEAVVPSGFLPPLMMILPSVSVFVLLPCLTWVPVSSLVMVMSPSPM